MDEIDRRAPLASPKRGRPPHRWVIPRRRQPAVGWSHALGSSNVIATPTVTSYASQLAGRPVTIACHRDQSFAVGVLGYTLYDEAGVVYPVIYLPASTCNRLNALASPSRLVVRDTRRSRTAASAQRASSDLSDGAAVDTLIHEATHIREQSTNESRVECDSYRNRWSAVKLFHLPAARDRAIMRGIIAAHVASPPSYLKDC
jgi:hypothetical protein